ncbi:HAD family hydrolase [Paraliomyxa miuraensis]|uniref:HAD family hydrolase n=1 Tax=Paraliomyxa miuraensis TaxID=376150 RepID=UPI00225B6781|nr:HAD family hydrolase [Paraliomyxa miuraensis]MCX4245604.1 haloacid dehalogenase-like hydrolase [Paraliomyxa miuraensis]
METRATILLFDIDGTLLDAHGAGRRAMEAGFLAVTGRADGLAEVRFAGMTDPSIVRAGLRAAGLVEDDGVIASVISAYLERLPAELGAAPPRVLAGVHAVLEAVTGRAAVGVGTGNVEAGARAKLDAAGLGPCFGFGGFGSDHEQRAELLRVGARRGAARLGRAMEHCRVVVIGDTPRDVEAARAIEAQSLAVATSHYDEAALREAGATMVVGDLAAPEALAWLRARLV